MADSSSAINSSHPVPKLPNGFSSYHDIQAFSTSKVTMPSKEFVNFIGFCSDFMKPEQTRGSDHMSTITLKDPFSPYDDCRVRFRLFSEQDKLPRWINQKDAVLIRQIPIQIRNGDRMGTSANGRNGTEVHVLPGDILRSKPPGDSAIISTLWETYSLRKDGRSNPPTPEENRYLMELVKSKVMDMMQFPPLQISDLRTNQSVACGQTTTPPNIAWPKFRLLSGVRDRNFCDLVAEVIRCIPVGDRLKLYVTDYTYNNQFLDQGAKNAGKSILNRESDVYGYTKTNHKDLNAWNGPNGKTCVQLTLWDEQVNFALEDAKVKEGDWVLLKNVQMKLGEGLEGEVRNDRSKGPGYSLVQKLEKGVHYDMQEWKDAVGRKRDYIEKQKRAAEKRKFEADVNDGKPKLNSKARRKQKRAKREEEVTEADNKSAGKLGLNSNNIPISSLMDILKPQSFPLGGGRQPCIAPFSNRKYRANVRVVDYFPGRLEDFAVGRQESEYDILSNCSDEVDSQDEESDVERSYNHGGSQGFTWEWRFALLVEDGSDRSPENRMWLMVDNAAAQSLLDLEENAENLRTNKILLGKVRERLFHIWGELEERKSATLKPSHKLHQMSSSAMILDAPASSPVYRVGAQPDADSDGEDILRPEHAITSASTVLAEQSSTTTMDCKSGTVGEPKNRAFTCCIQQYGVKVDEQDPNKADAGEGQRWQRMFGLFGTTVH